MMLLLLLLLLPLLMLLLLLLLLVATTLITFNPLTHRLQVSTYEILFHGVSLSLPPPQ